MQLTKSFSTISLLTIFIVSCSSVQVTEESVRESSIATVEVSTSDTYETKSTACLLYTSPSPRDRQKSRMPSSA